MAYALTAAKYAVLVALAFLFWIAVGHGHSWVFAAVMLAAPSRPRRCGKSMIAAVLDLHATFFKPGSLTLLVSPSLRQSSEPFRMGMACSTTAGTTPRAGNASG